MKYPLIALALAAILCSCKTTSLPPSLYTSKQVAEDVKFVSKQALPVVSAKAKTAVHLAATQLLALSTGTVSADSIASIVTALKIAVPAQDAFIVGFVEDAITTGLNWALTQYGAKNPIVIQYTTAVGQALLDSGF